MKKSYGISLIQLMIVIAVMAILAIISTPVYQNYVITNNMHAAAETALKDVQFMQKWYDICGTYAKDSTSSSTPQCFTASSSTGNLAWPTLPYQVTPESGTSLYRITFTSAAPSTGNGSRDFNSFRLIATPLCGTIQASSGCVCIDQDSNIIENANASCSNAGGLCSCTN